MKIRLISIIAAAGWIFLGAPAVFGQEDLRDPFDSLLPATLPVPMGQGSLPPEGTTVLPPPVSQDKGPDLKVQGVLWGTNKPQVLIEGNIYGVGDDIKGMDAKIYAIKKNKISVVYQGRLYQDIGVIKHEAGNPQPMAINR